MQAGAIFAAWLRTRLAMRASAEGLARRRERQWRALQPALRLTPALAAHAGGPLADFPIVEPAGIRADYGRWNSLGLSHEALHAAAADAEAGGSGEAAPGVVAGYSTGTTGARGLFVASELERADYIGQSLARMVPIRALLRPVRIALFLRSNSRLYSDVGGRRFAFAYFPLGGDLGAIGEALTAFSPTILIAPPHRLVEIAAAASKGTIRLADLEQVWFGAEPTSEPERGWVARALGVRPQPLYQATEGFLAAACPRGRLHLNEHSLAVELEPVAGTGGFRPIVTDLRRRSQPIVRVRLDDFVELDPGPCRCGFKGRAIRPPACRVSDLWRFGEDFVPPRLVVETLDDALGMGSAWRAEGSPAEVRLKVDPSCNPRRAERAARALQRIVPETVPVHLVFEPALPLWPKRRRMSWSSEHG